MRGVLNLMLGVLLAVAFVSIISFLYFGVLGHSTLDKATDGRSLLSSQITASAVFSNFSDEQIALNFLIIAIIAIFFAVLVVVRKMSVGAC